MKLMLKDISFLGGAGILILLGISYFVEINIEMGANYVVKSSLLGIIIFNNPFILAFYLLIAIFLISYGLKRK